MEDLINISNMFLLWIAIILSAMFIVVLTIMCQLTKIIELLKDKDHLSHGLVDEKRINVVEKHLDNLDVSVSRVWESIGEIKTSPAISEDQLNSILLRLQRLEQMTNPLEKRLGEVGSMIINTNRKVRHLNRTVFPTKEME